MKLITETDCPHCKKTHEAELDLENLEMPKQDIPKMTVKASIPEQNITNAVTDEPIIQTKIKIPSHIPKYKCKNCDKLHDNPDYKKRPRFKCENCDQLNPSEQCEFCNKGESFEELSDDDLDNLGIVAPNHEHVHEDE